MDKLKTYYYIFFQRIVNAVGSNLSSSVTTAPHPKDAIHRQTTKLLAVYGAAHLGHHILSTRQTKKQLTIAEPVIGREAHVVGPVAEADARQEADTEARAWR